MQYKKIIHIVAWSFTCIMFCGLFLFMTLPQIVESEVKKRLPQGFESMNFQIQKIGFENFKIEHIKIADGLSVDSVSAEYTIKSLKELVLDKIVVSGLNIQVNVDENKKIQIQGFTLPVSNSNEAQSKPFKFLSYLPKKVVLKNSSVVININGKSYNIPFESLSNIQTDKNEMILQTKIFPFGEAIRASINLNLETMTVQSVQINSESFDLEHINPIISQFSEGVALTGPTQFEFRSESIKTNWKAKISSIAFRSPFAVSIKDVNISARIDDQYIFSNGSFIVNQPFTPSIPLTFESNTQRQETFPTVMKMKSELKENFEVSLNDGVMSINGGKLNFDYNGTLNKGQGKFIINTNQGNLTYEDQSLGFEKMHFSADSKIDLKKDEAFLSSSLLLSVNNLKADSKMGEASFQLATTSGSFNMGKGNQAKLDLKMESELKENFEVSSNFGAVSVNGGKLNLDYKGTINQGNGELTIKLNQGRIKYQDQTLEFEKMHFNADSKVDLKKDEELVSSNLLLSLNTIKANSEIGEASFPLVTTFGSFIIGKNKQAEVNLYLKSAEGKIKSSKYKTSVSGIQFEMPFSYPFNWNQKEKQGSGKYKISNISYDNQYHFGVAGNLIQTGQNQLKIDGNINLMSIPHIKTQFDSDIAFLDGFSLNGSFNTNTFNLSYRDIEKVIPNKIQSVEIDVTSSAKGRIKFKHNNPTVELQVDISDGTLKLPDLNLNATGVNSQLKFRDLIKGESVPGQVLTIDTIEMNQVKMNNAKIRFTIEDKETYLVENISLDWCEGLVTSESIRFRSGKDNYAVTLFCDRLDLAQLLKQMGAFSAEGNGTLNGRIPVIYSDGNIAFDNGFLFSTPGSGGNVVIENAEKLMVGIPMGSPQFSQLDLAQEALKDFDYKWAKLVFNSFEDTLIVNMELDGKPSKPLPFVFKKEFGGFARVDASNPGSNFQGIKLDVNLKLPFNEVMKFGNKLKAIFE